MCMYDRLYQDAILVNNRWFQLSFNLWNKALSFHKLTVLCISTEPHRLLGWSLKCVKNSEVIWSFSRRQPTSRLSHNFLPSLSFFPGENCFSVSKMEGYNCFQCTCVDCCDMCRKTKQVIILTNHTSYGKGDKPIRSRSCCMQPAKSAGKRVRARRDWFWFDFWLVKCIKMKSCNNANTKESAKISFSTQPKLYDCELPSNCPLKALTSLNKNGFK